MAFSRKKDVKKSSYYVWFLGAKECEGLRGEELVLPVLRYLLDRENYAEPSKVTLQVSNKGMKIIQNVPRKGCKIAASLTGKTEQIKHLIPHTSITCVVQEEDIVCTILLIYNPITKCPVHVHAYRCDSIETATSLRAQLQILIDRPENQRKFRDIEARLAAKGLCVSSPPLTLAGISPSSLLSTATTPSPTQMITNPQGVSPSSGNHHHLHHHSKYIGSPLQKKLSSDGRSVRTDSSDQTDDSFPSSNTSSSGHGGGGHKTNGINNSNGIVGGGNKSPPIDCIVTDSKVAILYESLAAELKAKLGNPKTGPILLPPRDYDTISRKQGKLTGIETRKSTNCQIVGPIVEVYGNNSGADTLSGVDDPLNSSGHQCKPLKSHKISSHSMSKLAGIDTCCSSYDDSSGGDVGGNIHHHRVHDDDCSRLIKKFSSSSALASSSSHSSTSISFNNTGATAANTNNNHNGNINNSIGNVHHHHNHSSSSSKLSRPQSSCKSSSGIGSDEAILPPSSSELNLTTHHRYSVNNLLSVTSGGSNSSTSANSSSNSPPVKVNHSHHRNKKHPAPPPPPAPNLTTPNTTTTTKTITNKTTSIMDSHHHHQHSNGSGRLSSNVNGKLLTSSKTESKNKSGNNNSSSGHRSLPLLVNSSSGEDSYMDGDDYQWAHPSLVDNIGEPDWSSSGTSDDILSSNRPCHVPPPVIPKVRVQSTVSPNTNNGIGGGLKKCSPMLPSSSSTSSSTTKFNQHHSCSQVTSHTKSSPTNQSKIFSTSTSASPSSPSSSSSSFSSSSPFSSPSHSQMAKISGGTRTTTTPSTGIIKSGDLCKLTSTAPKTASTPSASTSVSASVSAKKLPSTKLTVPSVPVIREPPKYYFSDPQHGDFMPPARNKITTSSQNIPSVSSPEAFKSRSESIHLPSSSSGYTNNNNNNNNKGNTCCSSPMNMMDSGIVHNRLSSYSKISSSSDTNRNHNTKSVPNSIKTGPPPSQSYPVKDHHFHHHLSSSSYHPNSHHLHHQHRSPISY